MKAALDSARWLVGYIRNLLAWGRHVAEAVDPVDVWHLHDLPALVAISNRVDRSVPIVYDSHEIFLDTGTADRLPRPLRRLVGLVEARLVRRVDTLITVNGELATILGQRFRPARTLVVHNCPPWAPPVVGLDRLRAATGILASTPLILHHGSLSRDRGIETLVEALQLPELAGAHLALLGFGELRDMLSALALEVRFGGRLHILDPVPTEELREWVATADIGAIAMPATSLNLRMSTPNKLFECLSAGVPVVVSNFPAVTAIVNDPLGSLGASCDPSTPASVASAIASILQLPVDERQAMRDRCLAAARDRWNWETESRGLIGLYERIASTTEDAAAGAPGIDGAPAARERP